MELQAIYRILQLFFVGRRTESFRLKKVPGPAETQDFYLDAFDGGKLMTWEQFCSFLTNMLAMMGARCFTEPISGRFLCFRIWNSEFRIFSSFAAISTTAAFLGDHVFLQMDRRLGPFQSEHCRAGSAEACETSSHTCQRAWQIPLAGWNFYVCLWCKIKLYILYNQRGEQQTYLKDLKSRVAEVCCSHATSATVSPDDEKSGKHLWAAWVNFLCSWNDDSSSTRMQKACFCSMFSCCDSF